MNILIVCLLGGLLFFAIHRRRYVKLNMKFLGATVLIEAADQPGVRDSMSVPLDSKQTAPSPAEGDQKLIERTGAK
jgi:hypothetical protein